MERSLLPMGITDEDAGLLPAYAKAGQVALFTNGALLFMLLPDGTIVPIGGQPAVINPQFERYLTAGPWTPQDFLFLVPEQSVNSERRLRVEINGKLAAVAPALRSLTFSINLGGAPIQLIVPFFDFVATPAAHMFQGQMILELDRASDGTYIIGMTSNYIQDLASEGWEESAIVVQPIDAVPVGENIPITIAVVADGAGAGLSGQLGLTLTVSDSI